jgi:hypothetical protein
VAPPRCREAWIGLADQARDSAERTAAGTVRGSYFVLDRDLHPASAGGGIGAAARRSRPATRDFRLAAALATRPSLVASAVAKVIVWSCTGQRNQQWKLG